ncbi:Bcr/CflA family drug resistance efflux transporter [Prevotella sp. oral taxon 820]|nr:Bcr/CflA family drug resistance efflux transporter [Prevotella sp. oral taxon 820]
MKSRNFATQNKMMMMKSINVMCNSRLFLEGILGLLSAFGPFVMDMYLAAFPEIAMFYRTEPSMVQLSLTACTVGLACGQLVFGAVSDAFGRKNPLLASLILYVVASFVCMESPSITIFIAMRFFQGLAAAGGVVISRSIAADRYAGAALARMYGVIGMINGVSTVVAPMFGGAVIDGWGWKAVFLLLLIIGLVMFLGTVALPESLPVASRQRLNPSVFVQGMKMVATNRKFSSPTVQYGFVMAMIFINLASGPFIMNRYGLTPGQISLVFGVNAVAIAIAAGVASGCRSMRKTMRIANIGMLVFAFATSATLLLELGFWIYEIAVFCMYLFIGGMCTASTTLAMEAERENAGMASAIFGTIGFVAGGIVSPLVGIGDILLTTSLLFVVVSAAAFYLSSLKGDRNISIK